jgi:hypothetical protein
MGLAFAQPSDVPVPLKLDLRGKRGREGRRIKEMRKTIPPSFSI